jgi:hypothetical protein
MNDEAFRNVAADSMAQGYIVEILLTQYLKTFPPQLRQSLVETLLSNGKRTDHFAGLAKDDQTAEMLSDVVVRMHNALEGLVARSVQRLLAGEAARG